MAVIPPTKHVGGKSKLAPDIHRIIRGIAGHSLLTSYAEPFVGMGGLFCHLVNEGMVTSKTKITLRDAHASVVRLWTDIRDQPEELIKNLNEAQKEYAKLEAEFQSAYFYRVRREWNEGATSSVNYVFLKQTAFNGLWRENASGGQNSSFGRYKNPRMVDAYSIHELSKVLANADISIGDATRELVAAEVVYLDPPYFGTFTDYTADGFTAPDLVRLIGLYSHRPGVVLLSNSEGGLPWVELAAPHAEIHELETSYTVNRDGAGRADKREIVAVI